jgi:hypothetical protein
MKKPNKKRRANTKRRTHHRRRRRRAGARARRTPEQPRYFAMDLSDCYLAEMHPGADAQTRDDIQSLILCAGQHLADCGAPGAWHLFEPESFLPRMPGDPSEIRDTLVDLFHWLGDARLIAPAVARDIVRRLRG